MRGQLLILTFGLAILFHGATSSRSEHKNGNSTSIKNAGRRLTKNEIQEMAKTMGAINYEEFSSSASSSASASEEEFPKNGKSNDTSNESSNVSIRRQRATNSRSFSNEQNYEDSNGSGSSEYQSYHGVMGKPGRDFPVLTHIPKTKFTCRRLKSGYYADLDTDCQVFHICDNGRKISFLCPNGTIFRQNDQICDWWFKVECQNGASLISSASNEDTSIEQRNSRRLVITKRPVETLRELSNINFTDSDELVSFEASTYQKPAPYQQIPSEQKSNFQNTNQQKTEFENRQSNQHSSSFQIFNQQFGSSTSNPTTQSSLRFTNSHHQSRNLFSTTTPIPQVENNSNPPTPTKTFNQPKYQPISNIRNRTRTSKFVTDNNRKSNEAQIPAESASFTANSNKRYYQQGVVNRQSNNIVEQKSQITNNKEFTRNNAFVSNSSSNKTQTNSSNQSTNYSKSTRKYTRRPFGRYSSKVRQNVTTTTPVNNEFKFNESFAKFTSTPAPLVQTTTNKLGGHFVTFTFPTQAPARKQTPQRHVFSEPAVQPTEPTTPYVTPKIDSLYSKVTKSYGEVQTTEITPELFRLNLNTETTTPYFAFLLPANISDPTIFSPENTIDLFTTTEKPKYSQSVTKYSPTVPTITPKPSGRSLGTTPANDLLQNDVAAENAIRMLHTLDEVVDEVVDEPQGTPPRPGLKIPPSSSPDTLHSLAVYFAAASTQDQQNVNSEPTTSEIVENKSDLESSSLLTKSTLEQYNQLFTSSKSSPSIESEEIDDERKIIKEIDLDYQQSQGLVQSDHQNNIENVNATNIRKLARVFTHALSEYLKDPETFRKVLTEIRPKEPSDNVDSSISTTTIFTDHPSITKEEGEVLDFSDVVKTTPRNIRYYQQSTEAPTTTIDSLNPLAVQLNKEFQIYDQSQNYGGSRESNETGNESVEDDYFPVNYSAKKETPSPYGKDVKPNNSQPLGANEYLDSLTTEETPTSTTVIDTRSKYLIPEDLNNLAVIRVNDELYANGAKQLTKDENDEKLQIAFSQSFVNNPNSLERLGKSQNFQIIVTTTDLSTTTDQSPQSTTTTVVETTTNIPESTSYYPFYDFTNQYDSTTTQQTTTQEITEKIPENHWSNNPEISRFLQQTVTLDPNLINELITTSVGNTNDESTTTFQSTTEQPTSSTAFETTTIVNDILQTTTEIKETKSGSDEIVSLAESNDLRRKGKSYSQTDDGVLTQQFVLNLPKEPMEKQMESAKMMFGSLNTTSQNIIMEKMKHADNNKSVRKLILLLISTCDLNHNRTLEHARKAILNALINVKLDSDENNDETVIAEDRIDLEDLDTYATGGENTNYNRNRVTSSSTTTTTVQPEEHFEITTYKNVDFILPSRNAKKIDPIHNENNVPTQAPAHQLQSSYTTTDRIDHNLDLLPEIESNSDKRALELLRSLYSLASRWARK